MNYIYADHAATTKISETAKKAMLDCMEEYYGNPSSLHTAGQMAAEQLLRARETAADLLGADPKEIYFTSGGSEADNQAILSAAYYGKKNGKTHVISTAFEHHAVLHTLKKLEKEGFEVTLLDVHENGIVTPEQVADAIREDTALVTIMYANNEIGTIQPIREIGAVCREKKVPFHTDAVQAVGHIPVNVEKDNIDMLSLSGHKFQGPKGVGLLYAKRGMSLVNIIEGGAQERGKRAGTENLPAIVGMVAALEESIQNMEQEAVKVSAMRDQLIEGLSQIPRSRLNGDRKHRLPGIVNFVIEGAIDELMLIQLDNRGIAASSGSACAASSLEPSHVLLALGLSPEVARGSLRLSIGAENTPEEMEYIIKSVKEVVAQLRGE